MCWLFDFRFFENHVFAHDGIIFAKFHFLRRITGIFPRDIEKTRVSRAQEFDLNGGLFGHYSDTVSKI